MKVYISGPMTGLPDSNFPAFFAKAEELRKRGFSVVNPAENGQADGMEWHEYLRLDIKQLVDCDIIYMLPGWSKSKGARLELHIAKQLGMFRMGQQKE